MARIQDIKQFEELINETVNEYLQERDCYEDPVLAIYREEGQLQVVIDDPENMHLSKDSETYPIAGVVCASDEDVNQLEPDYDGISMIANQWVFIEH